MEDGVNGKNGLSVTNGVGLGSMLESETAQTPLRETVGRTVKDFMRRSKVASWSTVVSGNESLSFNAFFHYYSCSLVANLEEPTMWWPQLMNQPHDRSMAQPLYQHWWRAQSRNVWTFAKILALSFQSSLLFIGKGEILESSHLKYENSRPPVKLRVLSCHTPCTS